MVLVIEWWMAKFDVTNGNNKIVHLHCLDATSHLLKFKNKKMLKSHVLIMWEDLNMVGFQSPPNPIWNSTVNKNLGGVGGD